MQLSQTEVCTRNKPDDYNSEDRDPNMQHSSTFKHYRMQSSHHEARQETCIPYSLPGLGNDSEQSDLSRSGSWPPGSMPAHIHQRSRLVSSFFEALESKPPIRRATVAPNSSHPLRRTSDGQRRTDVTAHVIAKPCPPSDPLIFGLQLLGTWHRLYGI